MHKYIKTILIKCKSMIPKRQPEQSEEEYRKVITMLGLKFFAVALATIAIMNGAVNVAKNSVTVSNSVNGRQLPIYCVETEKKQVALSFDAAWGNEDTEIILNILKKHNIHVTFFMTGGWVEAYPDDVKAILAAGHDIGNHSENHKNMSKLSDEECQEELMKVHERVKELTGYEMYLFRPPYGDYDDHVIINASKLGYKTIQWDVDILVTIIKTGNMPNCMFPVLHFIRVRVKGIKIES